MPDYLSLFENDRKINGDKWLVILETRGNSVWDASCIKYGDTLMKEFETYRVGWLAHWHL